MDFLQALHSRVVLGDGAMGTLLLSRGVPREACLEELCVSRPEMIGEIHREYLAAGTEVIRTHSFGSNASRLRKHGMEKRVGELNWLAARIAREAVQGTSAIVAASIGPTGAGEGARVLLEEQMGALLDGGVDIVFLETFTQVAELLVAVEVKQSLHHCPVVASLACADRAEVSRAFGELRAAGADVVGVNCAGDPLQTAAALEDHDLDDAIAAFPNAGFPTDDGHRLVYPLDAASFAEQAADLPRKGVRFLGGCCGTTPAYISALVAQLALRQSPSAR